jgi:nitrite reductase/ring-hydroxylating ferredoxin subunit
MELILLALLQLTTALTERGKCSLLSFDPSHNLPTSLMSVFNRKPVPKLDKLEPSEDGRYAVGLASSFSFGRGKRVLLGDREVAVFVMGDDVHALDAHCYHAGGPLDTGDIEDLGERRCVTCPWHHYIIDVRTGEGVHPSGVAASAGCATKGVKQRVHKANVDAAGTVWVELELEGERNSDYYSSDLYLRLMGKKR